LGPNPRESGYQGNPHTFSVYFLKKVWYSLRRAIDEKGVQVGFIFDGK